MTNQSRYQQIAEEAQVSGRQIDQVLATLRARIERDDRYRERRRRHQCQTRYDEQVMQDFHALALAIFWREQTSSLPGVERDANHS